jgi:hypothetical protein
MRARFIKVGIRERMMVRTNNTAALCHVADTLKGAGFVEVGLIRFWLHVVRPRRVKTYEPKVKIKASK